LVKLKLERLCMLKIIDDKNSIKKAYKEFVKKFKPFIDEKIRVKVGHLGASYFLDVFWISKFNIWVYFKKGRRGYWIPFGIGKPKEGSNVSIICEINFPLKGIDRKRGGVFVEDISSGDIFLAHRGKIGGGRKGIGKSLFENHYRGEWVSVNDGGIENKVALIGAINSMNFVKQVSEFVFEVKRIKDLVSSHDFKPLPKDFRKEFFGEKEYKIEKNNIHAKCDHGLIVNELADSLKKQSFNVGNDRYRDLYIIRDKRVVAVFEIKTDTSPTSIYCAVGQLLLHNFTSPRPMLILVVPHKIKKNLKEILSKLKIETLAYKLENDKLVFQKNFKQLIKRLKNKL